jgi:L-seryl-tRNA(Ser) seleniumtransferase
MERPALKAAASCYPPALLKRGIRETLERLRNGVHAGEVTSIPDMELLDAMIMESLRRLGGYSLRRVINGTGVVIHTNLGRSPLPQAVIPHLAEIACGYCNLEYDLSEGGRGSRYTHLESLLCELTGAEASLVVNNNAAAILLAIATMAKGGEAVVSRGELVEIGGSFRIPEVLQQGGASLREVGTTNRTHIRDYRDAITSETAILLKVEASNFAMVGYTASVSAVELADLGREVDIPVLADLGSGNLLDMSAVAGRREATVQELLKAGVDVVTCSGDKLLGGPQAGIIIGKKAHLDKMRRHPLLRALRVDKLTIAALEGVLQFYRDEKKALAEIPVLRMLSAGKEEVAVRARGVLRRLRRHNPPLLTFGLLKGVSQVGGGALPMAEIPTTLITVQHSSYSPQELDAILRNAALPVIGRIARDTYMLDMRTVLDNDIPDLVTALLALSP